MPEAFMREHYGRWTPLAAKEAVKSHGKSTLHVFPDALVSLF